MKVIIDQDGAVDDLISTMMLLAMPHIDLQGIVVTPADCFLPPSVSATLKILRFFNRTDIEVGKGHLYGVNSFPRDWRKVSYAIDALPILNESQAPLGTPVAEPGHDFLARKLREAEEPLTILITGPVSNIAAALEQEPNLTSRIKEIVWMGGALRERGNVQDYGHDGTAEWNAYWDPTATHRLFQQDVPITLFPLDVTNHVPVTMAFLQKLAQQRSYPLSDLAGQCWAMTVGTIPAYEYIYFMWDTLSTGYLGAPHCIEFREARCQTVASGPSAGRIHEAEQGGRLIRVADTVNVDGFLDYVLTLFKQ